jgi:WD40 repeat protein
VEVLGIIERAGCPQVCRSQWISGTPCPLTFSTDGKRVVLIEQRSPRKLISWQTEDKHNISSRPLRFHSSAYAISPDAEWVAGIQANGVDLEHVRDPNNWFLLQSVYYEFTALTFSPDGHTLATADAEGAVKLWPWRRLIEA